jgi:hypothetical protein
MRDDELEQAPERKDEPAAADDTEGHYIVNPSVYLDMARDRQRELMRESQRARSTKTDDTARKRR